MNDIKKEKSAEQTKFETELLTLCDKYEVDAENMTKDFFNELYIYVEQKLSEAEKKGRIEENKYWQNQAVQLVKFGDGAHWQDFTERISELEKK
jgi:hypothetical protein